MKSLKRLFVAFVAAAMMLSTMVTGFAAPFTDASGQKFESSVNKLQQLNVFVGKGDGSFGYSEKVTRAEMAAILVKLAGFSGEVESAKNSDSAFTDVANHWSKGEVNVAYQHGLIAGVGDGKFNPDGNVTYGEVITMVMKLLKYGPVVDKTGVWPFNYINKASQNGIELYKDVAISATAAATRGDIAKIADNALTADTLVEDGYSENGNPTYKSSSQMSNGSDYKLLYRVFDAYTFEKEVVTSVPAMTGNSDDANKVGLAAKDTTVTVPLTGSVKLAKGIVDNVNGLLYMEVSGIYKYDKDNNEDLILSIVPVTKTSSVIKDTVKNITYGATTGLTQIEFSKAGKKDVKSDAKFVLDYNEVTADVFYANLTKANGDIVNDTIAVSAVINSDGKITNVNAFVNKELTFGSVQVYSGVVRDKSSSEIKVLKLGGNKDSTTSLYYVDMQTGIDQNGVKATVIRDGKAVKIGDLQKGDQVTFFAKGSTTKYGTHSIAASYYVSATSAKAISGKKIDSIVGTSKDTLKLVVDGVQYKVASGLVYNKGTSSTIKDNAYILLDTDLRELGDFLTEPANIILNNNGDIAYIESVNMIASANEATSLVVNAASKTVDGESRQELTVLKADGTFVVYVTSDTTTTPYAAGDLIKYKINSKGEIDVTTVTKYSAGTALTINKNLGTINNMAVTSSTAFFNSLAPASSTLGYSNKYEITTWDAIKDYAGAINLSAIYTKDGQVKAVFVDSQGLLSSAAQSGLVVASGVNSDGVYVKMLVGGNERQYKLNNTGAVYATNGNYVGLTVTGNTVTLSGNGDEYCILSASSAPSTNTAAVYRAKIDAGVSTAFTVKDLYMNSIQVVSEGNYKVMTPASDVNVYDATDKNAVKKITISDIKSGDYFYAKFDAVTGEATVIVKINSDDLHTTVNANS